MKRWVLQFGGIFAFLLVSSCGYPQHKAKSPDEKDVEVVPVRPNTVEWRAFDVNHGSFQADANLLKFSDGQAFLIDAGDASGTLVAQLKRSKITKLDKIFISHPHKDHYGGLKALAHSNIELSHVFLNFNRPSCDAEKPWGCDFDDVLQTVALLTAKGVKVGTMSAGDIYYDRENIQLEVLYAYDGVSTPVGPTDINDTSVIMRLRNGDMTVLFTGDLNSKLGQYLADSKDPKLKAKLLKVPHHGTESAAPNAFFDFVAPTFVLIPSPANLWQSNRSKRIREWVQASRATTHVTGKDGQLRVILKSHSFVKF